MEIFNPNNWARNPGSIEYKIEQWSWSYASDFLITIVIGGGGDC